MSTPIPLFKFSRDGTVIREEVSLAVAVRLIAGRTILPTDHYWTEGMTDWKLVSSRGWESPPEATKPATAPAPVVTPPLAQSKPMVSPTAASAVVPPVVEKGFSPYATYYRSKDSNWGYGIFGGLAHRNGWSSATLFQVRFFTLIFFFPALAYICVWGLVVMLMTPALPTKNLKSYFDVSG